MKLTLVTGNENKLREWRRLLPPEYELECVDVDLGEIQSLNPEEIVADKARRAYKVVGKPLVVEDISAGLEKLGGLPGPFVKFFEKKLGQGALWQLAGGDNEKATVSCIVAYYDGETMLTLSGNVNGTIVRERGPNGFGFDKVFMPDGQTKTYGEMTPEEKDKISHRSKAISLLADRLKDLST